MTLEDRERRIYGDALQVVRRLEVPHLLDGDDVGDAAIASRILKALASRASGGVSAALYRTHQAFLRELYHEGIITRDEAGLRAPRRSRVG